MSDDGGGTSSAVETILQAIKREVGEVSDPVGITPPLPALSTNDPVINPYDRRKPPTSSYIDRYGRRVFFKEQVRVGQLGRPPITSWTFSKPVQFSSCGSSISSASPKKLQPSPLPVGTNKVISARPKPAPPAVQQPVPPYLMSRVRARQKRTHQWAVPARAVLDDQMNPKYTQCRLCSETISLRKPGYCVFHVHMHAGYKQYQCSNCDYGHFSMKFVRLHMRRIHSIVDPEPIDMITEEMRTHWGRLALECFPDQLHVCRMLDPNNDAMPDAERDREFARSLLKEGEEGETQPGSKSLADVLAEVMSSQEASSSQATDEGSVLDEVLAAEKVKKEVSSDVVDGLDEAESELWDSEHSEKDKQEAAVGDEPGAKRIKDEPIDEDEQPSCSKDGDGDGAKVKDEPIEYDELFAKNTPMPVINMPLPVSKSGEVMCIACKRAGNDIVMLPSQARNLNVVIAQMDLPVQNRYAVSEHAKMRPGAPLPVCRSHFANGNLPEIEYPHGERERVDGSLIEQLDATYRPYRFSQAQRRAIVQRTMISQRMAMQKRSDFLDRCAQLVPTGAPLVNAEVEEGTGVSVSSAAAAEPQPEKPARHYSTRGTAPQDSDPRYKKCLMCNRSVMNIMLGGNSALVMHAKAHCDLKRYYCPVCGYQSLVERNVIKHIEESHPESRKKPADRNGPAMETLWKNTAIRCFPDAFRIQSGVKARVPISQARPNMFHSKIPHRPIPIQYHIPKPLNLHRQPSMVSMVRRVVPVNRDGTLKRPIVTPKTAVTSRSSDVMVVTSHNAPPVPVRLDGKEDEPLFEAKEEIKEETPDE